jgi:hypothetical protein
VYACPDADEKVQIRRSVYEELANTLYAMHEDGEVTVRSGEGLAKLEEAPPAIAVHQHIEGGRYPKATLDDPDLADSQTRKK